MHHMWNMRKNPSKLLSPCALTPKIKENEDQTGIPRLDKAVLTCNPQANVLGGLSQAFS